MTLSIASKNATIRTIVEYCYAECHYDECHYAQCRGALQAKKFFPLQPGGIPRSRNWSYLKNTFDGENSGEKIVEIFQHFISRMIFLNLVTSISKPFFFDKIGLGQVRVGQGRVGQGRVGQGRVGQGRVGQVRLGQVRLGQVRLGQVRLGQVRLGQVRLGQVRLDKDSLCACLGYIVSCDTKRNHRICIASSKVAKKSTATVTDAGIFAIKLCWC